MTRHPKNYALLPFLISEKHHVHFQQSPTYTHAHLTFPFHFPVLQKGTPTTTLLLSSILLKPPTELCPPNPCKTIQSSDPNHPSSKMAKTHLTALVILLLFLFSALVLTGESAIGVNWGTLSSHKLAPSVVVDLIKENGILKVKLFDADPVCLRALMGSKIQVMVGIPNEMLGLLSSSPVAADLWVRENVSRYAVKGGVDIRCVWMILIYLSSGLVLFCYMLDFLSWFCSFFSFVVWN